MKLLLTNDDGIEAAGLAALAQAAKGLGDLIVVGPAETLSGCSHRVTTDHAFRVQLAGTDRYVVEGTPADCVRVGLARVAPHVKWVLSGINHGGNLGADVYHSGTVAAVREAVLHGWPGIAVSQYRRQGGGFDWDRTARWLAPVLLQLVQQPWRPGTFWNINLPDPVDSRGDPEVVECPLDPSPLPLCFEEAGEFWKYNGDYHARPAVPGCDVEVCFGGRIALTLISLFENP